MATSLPSFSTTRELFNVNVDTENQTPEHISDTYALQELGIIIKGNTFISLIDAMRRFEIYEDIYSPSITGKITILDYVGGLEKFFLTGGETIKIKVVKPNYSNEILISRDDFVVYKISKASIDDENSVTYDLHFTSKSTIESQKKRLFRSFGSDRSVLSIVKKIYGEIGNVSSLNINTVELSNRTENPFVCPGYTPLEAITQLARRSCVDGDYYVFYEKLNTKNTTDFKHVFIGLNALKKFWKSNRLPKVIYRAPENYITGAGGESILLARSIQIENNFEHLERMISGFYNSRTTQIDPYSRKFKTNKISYKEMPLGDEFYLNRFLENSNIFFEYDDSYPEFPGERLVVKPHNDAITNKLEWIKNDVHGGLLNSGIRLLIDVPGGTNKIGVGYVVELNLPSKVAKTLNLEGSLMQEDEMYSGKYLITAVRHMFTKETYIKKIEVSRGSIKANLDSRI